MAEAPKREVDSTSTEDKNMLLQIVRSPRRLLSSPAIRCQIGERENTHHVGM